MPEMKSIYELKMHEATKVKNNLFSLRIIRVPGGWIYYRIGEPHLGVFVPMNNEFKENEDFFIV